MGGTRIRRSAFVSVANPSIRDYFCCDPDPPTDSKTTKAADESNLKTRIKKIVSKNNAKTLIGPCRSPLPGA